jgi:hypothetical protein
MAKATATYKHFFGTRQQIVINTVIAAKSAGITASGTVKFKQKPMIHNTIAAYVNGLL